MTRERFLSDAELAAFMAAVRERRHKNQPRDYAFFALLANTGIRPSEARSLTTADVRVPARGGGWIRLNRPEKRHAPKPTNELALHDAVTSILREYCRTIQPGSPLFPFSKRQSARLFHFYSSKAGIPRTYRIYSLRHTAGMRLWRQTKDLRIIQAIMGHVRLKASTAYVHINPETVRDAYAAARTVG
jgi:integrase/recombinase XerC